MDVRIIRHAADVDVDDATKLMRALGDEPRAVVYDLTGTDQTDHLSDTLDTLNNYLSVWSACPVLIACDQRDVSQAVGKHPVAALLTMWPSVSATLAAARDMLPLDRYTVQLSPGLRAPAHARAFVYRILGRWGVLPLLNDAALVATELVTNGTRHAHTSMTVSVSRSAVTNSTRHSSIRLAVGDASLDAPELTVPKSETEGGRGLLVVDAVSQAWGVIPLDDGKSVWAVLTGRGDDQPT